MMKFSIFTVLLICMSFINQTNHEEWLVKGDSSLYIHGKTNVNAFTCGIPGFNKTNYLSYNSAGKEKVSFQQSCEIVINVDGFKCENSMMTRDLLKTLNANAHPTMNIKFKTISLPLSTVCSGQIISSRAAIDLAGKTSIYSIDLKVSNVDQNNLTLKGSRQICFSDFDLIPPSKMGGLVKVNDFIEVNFTFNLSRMN